MASNLTDSPTLRKSYTSKFKRDVVDHYKKLVTRNQIDIGDLKMSDNWIYRFCQRKGISDSGKTHTAPDCKLSEMDQCIIVTDFLFSVRCVKFNSAVFYLKHG
jgi:hypothetical protein